MSHRCRVSSPPGRSSSLSNTASRQAVNRLSRVSDSSEALARTEGELKTTQERLAGFEDRVDDRFDGIDDRFDRIGNTLDRLIQLHLDAATQPATAG